MVTTISGKILNSGGQPYTGSNIPTVSVRQVVPQASGVSDLLMPGIATYTAGVDGSLTVVLLSDTDGTAYEFQIEADVVIPWFTITLFNGQDKDWAEILPTTVPEIRPDLDRSVARVAQQLSSDVTISQILRGAIGLTARGEYVDTQFYRQGDLVSFQGNSYTPKLPVPIIGINPLDLNSWQVVALRGVPGGTGGNNAPYNSAGWQADTVNAPTRAAVANKIDQIETDISLTLKKTGEVSQTVNGVVNFLDTLTVEEDVNVLGGDIIVPNSRSVVEYAAPKVNPTFSGFVDVPDRPLTDDNRAAANIAWVRDYAEDYFNRAQRPYPIGIRSSWQLSGATFTASTNPSFQVFGASSGTLSTEIDQDGVVVVTSPTNGIWRLDTGFLSKVNPAHNTFTFIIKTYFNFVATNFGVSAAKWFTCGTQRRINNGAWNYQHQFTGAYVATPGHYGISGCTAGYYIASRGAVGSNNDEWRFAISTQEAGAGNSYSGQLFYELILVNSAI